MDSYTEKTKIWLDSSAPILVSAFQVYVLRVCYREIAIAKAAPYTLGCPTVPVRKETENERRIYFDLSERASETTVCTWFLK